MCDGYYKSDLWEELADFSPFFQQRMSWSWEKYFLPTNTQAVLQHRDYMEIVYGGFCSV